MTDEAERRYDNALSDDDLEWVNAAGEEIDEKDKNGDGGNK